MSTASSHEVDQDTAASFAATHLTSTSMAADTSLGELTRTAQANFRSMQTGNGSGPAPDAKGKGKGKGKGRVATGGNNRSQGGAQTEDVVDIV